MPQSNKYLYTSIIYTATLHLCTQQHYTYAVFTQQHHMYIHNNVTHTYQAILFKQPHYLTVQQPGIYLRSSTTDTYAIVQPISTYIHSSTFYTTTLRLISSLYSNSPNIILVYITILYLSMQLDRTYSCRIFRFL